MPDDSKHEPRINWKQDDRIPVLTDVVGPGITDDSSPYVLLDDEEMPEDPTPTGRGDADFDDQSATEEAEATSVTMEETAPPPIAAEVEPASELAETEPPAADLSDLRASLTAELDHAAARIVEESVADVEGLLTERISERLKDEIRGIVGAAVADFERRKKH